MRIPKVELDQTVKTLGLGHWHKQSAAVAALTTLPEELTGDLAVEMVATQPLPLWLRYPQLGKETPEAPSSQAVAVTRVAVAAASGPLVQTVPLQRRAMVAWAVISLACWEVTLETTDGSRAAAAVLNTETSTLTDD
jgi:hypothetical protein